MFCCFVCVVLYVCCFACVVIVLHVVLFCIVVAPCVQCCCVFWFLFCRLLRVVVSDGFVLCVLFVLYVSFFCMFCLFKIVLHVLFCMCCWFMFLVLVALVLHGCCIVRLIGADALRLGVVVVVSAVLFLLPFCVCVHVFVSWCRCVL